MRERHHMHSNSDESHRPLFDIDDTGEIKIIADEPQRERIVEAMGAAAVVDWPVVKIPGSEELTTAEDALESMEGEDFGIYSYEELVRRIEDGIGFSSGWSSYKIIDLCGRKVDTGFFLATDAYRLVRDGVITMDECKAAVQNFQRILDADQQSRSISRQRSMEMHPSFDAKRRASGEREED